MNSFASSFLINDQLLSIYEQSVCTVDKAIRTNGSPSSNGFGFVSSNDFCTNNFHFVFCVDVSLSNELVLYALY